MIKAEDDSRTRMSLLRALEQGDTERAWWIFFDKYSRIIHIWCRRWGATVEDSEDVVQETLLMVFRKIAQFQYNPDLSFRAWLKTIAHHHWIDALDRHRHAYPSHQWALSETARAARVATAVEEFQSILDRIADQEIMSLACARVRGRVSELAWHCFDQAAILGKSGDEVARSLEISLNYVHVNVFRVRKLIQDEIRALDHV